MAWRATIARSSAPRYVAFKFCLEPKLVSSLEREVDIMEKLREGPPHENLVRLQSSALKANPPFLVLEHVDGGDLTNWLASFGGKAPPAEDVIRVLTLHVLIEAEAHEREITYERHCVTYAARYQGVSDAFNVRRDQLAKGRALQHDLMAVGVHQTFLAMAHAKEKGVDVALAISARGGVHQPH